MSDSISETNEDFIHTKFGYCYFEMEFGKNPIVFNLYVHPEYRKTGQAKKLLQYVINEIRQTGYSGVIDIEATPREQSIDRDKLSDFYSGMGLHVLEKEVEKLKLAESQRDAAVSMVERLIEAGRMMRKPMSSDEFFKARVDYDALVAEWNNQAATSFLERVGVPGAKNG
ncbi:MAG: GNAT family N-acetyltransferase [Anaerolineaceae bacterium]